MKKGLDRVRNNFSKDDKRNAPESWAKGFIVRGKKVFHPYTMKTNNK